MIYTLHYYIARTSQNHQAYNDTKRLLVALVTSQANQQIKRIQKNSYKPIPQLKNPVTGAITSRSEEIAEIFRDYYEDLYIPLNADEIQHFLDSVQLPTLTLSKWDLLNSAI